MKKDTRERGGLLWTRLTSLRGREARVVASSVREPERFFVDGEQRSGGRVVFQLWHEDALSGKSSRGLTAEVDERTRSVRLVAWA